MSDQMIHPDVAIGDPDSNQWSFVENSDELEEGRYWPNDVGTLDFNARRALLQLIRGPFITADRNKELWQATLNNQEAIRSRLSDLFLELVVSHESGIAFVRNASVEELDVPKAVRSQPMTLSDTIMILSLRRELLIDSSGRVFIGREEMIEQLMHYRPVSRMDEAAFRKRLENSWSRLVKAGILQPIESEERCEISSVLALIFGVDEVKALQTEFDDLMRKLASEESGVVPKKEEQGFIDESIYGGEESE